MSEDFSHPVVAIGASAGGIEALKAFVAGIPSDTEASFVVLQHLSPDHESQLTEILSRSAHLPTLEAHGEMSVNKGHIYVLPPDRYLRIIDHGLFTEEPTAPRGQRMPIDHFMRSLAHIVGNRAIGVVLSGTGQDGAIGIREIKGAGGITFAQSPSTALYDGMPKAAIEIGAVDFTGSIEEICRELLAVTARKSKSSTEGFSREDLNGPISVLKARTGQDFSAYKTGTIGRRILRRMNLLGFDDIADYSGYLRTNENEVRQLFEDMLINVTCFFRDRDVWETIRTSVVRPMIEKAGDEPIRIWVPACSSGEEPYSLAMLFEEEKIARKTDTDWQIFASDLDADALLTGREGLYPASIESDIPSDILGRYFQKEGGSYRISKSLREQVVFARHNLLTDPPFSKLDLVSCRNFLIYLDNSYQRRVLDAFHFGLVEDGYLLLGTSESLGASHSGFKSVSAKTRIYQRLPGRGTAAFPVGVDKGSRNQASNFAVENRPRARQRELGDIVKQSLLTRFSPAAAAIHADGRIAYYHGSIRRFIDTPEGEPSTNLFDLLPPPLRARVRETLRAVRNGEDRGQGTARIANDGIETNVSVECVRINHADSELFLVSFQAEAGREVSGRKRKASKAAEVSDDTSEQVEFLENELATVREELQTTVEELETSNEELKASNEEAMAANEELQSANEELETSREELQSLNEELITVNNQLQEKIGEVERATDDLRNLLASTRLPVLFLNSEFKIASFTPAMKAIIDLRGSDIGRPLSDLAMKVDDRSLTEDCRAVLQDLHANEVEINSADGHIYLRRAQPYRTGNDRIDGVVVTYTDITTLATVTRRLEGRERQQRIIAELGKTAIGARDEQRFLEDVCSALRMALECDYAKILVYDEAQDRFDLRAGIGWKPGMVGRVSVDAGVKSQAGFTARTRDAVIVTDGAKERRFELPQLLTDHNVVSGISAGIFIHDRCWGVIGLHDREKNAFREEDLAVIVNAANIIAATVMQITRERSLFREQIMLELIIRAANMGVWRYEAAKGKIHWDERLRDMLGVQDTLTQPTFEAALEMIAPDDRERVEAGLERTLRTGAPFHEEFRFVTPDGDERWLSGRAVRIEEEQGKTVLGVSADITADKEVQERTLFMMRELDHRVKNLLSIILSITKITAGSTSDKRQFVNEFTERLNAMGRTHSLIAEKQWDGADLRSILESEVRQYRLGEAIQLSGPDIDIAPAAAQSISMAIHELATNAAKYGSLSVESGELDILWRIEAPNGERRLTLQWIERGGPKVEKPTRKGFGSTVLERILISQLDATVDLDFRETGLKAVITIPVAQLRNFVATPQRREPPRAEAPVSPAEVLGGKRVLVIDDEWLVAEQHAGALADVGAQVVGPFTQLKQVKDEVLAEPLDLAVVDYNIAGNAALGLIDKLGERGVPVLIVTAYGSSLDLPATVSAKMVLNKPASLTAVLNRAATLLARKAPHGESA
ncbi:chemotaxis protein CheB [Jiella marina]|uniref:chemotaxis protein CheB n=1 Tax=Jiella sp. LLJ827 TaxID=2917712 RepID=UPI0021012A6C|nr:chemotaxis protein CheB [Jiella sp. LLJ827]MCQ0987065.1 PAS domain-containing protein [Jiella sp. LLJ827]